MWPHIDGGARGRATGARRRSDLPRIGESPRTSIPEYPIALCVLYFNTDCGAERLSGDRSGWRGGKGKPAPVGGAPRCLRRTLEGSTPRHQSEGGNWVERKLGIGEFVSDALL